MRIQIIYCNNYNIVIKNLYFFLIPLIVIIYYNYSLTDILADYS